MIYDLLLIGWLVPTGICYIGPTAAASSTADDASATAAGSCSAAAAGNATNGDAIAE